LFNPHINGCSFNFKFNDDCFYLITLFNYSQIHLKTIKKNAIGNLVIEGIVVVDSGLWAIKIIDYETKN